jgi:hypothetical protein
MSSESGTVFMFCTPGLIFDGTEGVETRFHILCARTHFRRYRGRSFPFSCFALSDSFSAEPRASAPVLMFLRSRTHFRRCGGCQVPFCCFARPDSFSAVPRWSGPVFLVLMFFRSRTCFWRYGGCRVSFSYFVLPDMFSAVPSVGSHFLILRSWTHFRPCQVRWVTFSCFASPDSFLVVPRRRVSFLCFFLLPDSSSPVPRASGAIFRFCAPELVFGGTEGVGCHYHVLRARTHFRRYRGHEVPFHVLRSRARFRRYGGRLV